MPPPDSALGKAELATRNSLPGIEELGNPATGHHGPQMEHHTGGVLARVDDLGGASDAVGGLFRNRIARQLGDGSADPGDEAQGTTLIASGYKDTRMENILSSFKWFGYYCDVNSLLQDEEGCRDVESYLGHLFARAFVCFGIYTG